MITQSLHTSPSNLIRIEVNFSSSQLSPASPTPSLDKSYLREPSQVKLWKCQVTEALCNLMYLEMQVKINKYRNTN